MSFAIALHILSATIWVGGMFFAHFMLKPSSNEILQPPLRLALWVAVFKRFFLWVWLVSITIIVSGYWMIFGVFGGMANIGTSVHIMSLMGLIMLVIFSFIFFKPYQALKTAVKEKNYPLAGQKMNSIRLLVTANLVLGICTIIIASAGKYWTI